MKFLYYITLILPLAGVKGQNFTNPVIWEDLADVDVFRVDDTYYYSASTMHFSPGAPILESKDLVNWEFVGHSVPVLDFLDNPEYNLTDGQAYVKGIWASTLRYRESNGLFYWIGCIQFWTTYVYTSPSVTGPWEQSGIIDTCFYDCSLLIDDDDTMYVAYGNEDISVAQLNDDGLSMNTTEVIFEADMYIEGSRFYKRDGYYYILNDLPSTAEYVLKADSPFGPYEQSLLINEVSPPVTGGYPHQGGLVDTAEGDWYYMAFMDNYPTGRIPILAPITWDSEGWPNVTLIDGAWGESYEYPETPQVLMSFTGTDYFTSLGPQWEWNHNPDTTKYSVGNGLVLETATVNLDLYSSRNTLTHRILGPNSTATIKMDCTNMIDGDQAGLAFLRDASAWIGVVNDSGNLSVVMTDGLLMNADWSTASTGVEEARAGLSGTEIYLRAYADIAPGGTGQGTFSYSTDGSTFMDLGPSYTFNTTWNFFMGYRYGIFNHATTELGGSVTIDYFDLSQ